jgi:hypothetical protein
VLSVASASLDENEGFVQLPPAAAVTVGVGLSGVVDLVLVGVVVVGVVVVVVVVLALGAPDFSGPVPVVVCGATVEVVDGTVVVVVEVAAPLCVCALASDVRTGEGDPPTDSPMAIPPPTIAKATTAMPARAAALLRGLIVGGLSSVMHERLLGTVNEKTTREYQAPSRRVVSFVRCR